MSAHHDLPSWPAELGEDERDVLDVSLGIAVGPMQDMSVGTLLLIVMGGAVSGLHSHGFAGPACSLAAELVRGSLGASADELEQLAYRLEALGELSERLERANPHGKVYSARMDGAMKDGKRG